ncbi:hypothetical protein BK816_00650 [Boudabousia tangfeifanii]|uniref:Uncharacterized protein n=1 Tax=Boudabousia tangfeifanii TaxID=1912795 RepID=A0A1D9MI53_9ACTO|nr:hypothetical protein [Boudabousia tangfeifanii]AOZ71985.1 hypothetical protein BK816_00650 [Boudabousia tangfeifanii]
MKASKADIAKEETTRAKSFCTVLLLIGVVTLAVSYTSFAERFSTNFLLGITIVTGLIAAFTAFAAFVVGAKNKHYDYYLIPFIVAGLIWVSSPALLALLGLTHGGAH